MNRLRFLILLTLGPVLLPIQAIAQAPVAARAGGRIVGVVRDAETGRVLPDVQVYISGGPGAITDLNGRFDLTGVSPALHLVSARYLGYETARDTVRVAPGETARITFRLEPRPVDLGEALATADRSFTTVASQSVRLFDLQTRPTRSAQDLLRLTPGLVTAQHAGGGKAEQLFLRGFDADHGTDVHLSVDGVPVNLVSHGHGQGYADLHFVIPEVVEHLDIVKGPFDPRYGDFATAGVVAFRTRDHLDQNLVRFEGGAFGTGGLTALYQIPGREQHEGMYVAGQYYRSDGPFEQPQGLDRFNVFSKFHTHLSPTARLSVSASGFASAWDASGQIPQRLVETGQISRFGAVDTLEGGSTGRYDLNAVYENASDAASFTLQGFASRYRFRLYSNFTFFLENPALGDMIEQTDNRVLYGLNGEYRVRYPLGEGQGTTALGGGFRSDDIDVSLWHSPNRVRVQPRVDAGIVQHSLFAWIQKSYVPIAALRVQVGFRGDVFTYRVNDRLEGQPSLLPHASGFARQAVLSPKLNLVVSPAPSLDFFVNAGTGFHSNDARDVVIGRRVADLARAYERSGLSRPAIEERLLADRFDPAHRTTGTLPRAVSLESGMRARLGRRLNLGVAVWRLDLDREFVYVGDGGFTELSGRSRRIGVDLETRLLLLPWLTADADLNLARGRLRDEPAGADAIPLAPHRTSTGGLTARHPDGWQGSLRYVHVGARPAEETGRVTAQGYTVFTLLASYQKGPLRFDAVVENLFDTTWNEAQFDTESQLPGEAAPVSEIHFTPGNPRNLRLGIAYLF